MWMCFLWTWSSRKCYRCSDRLRFTGEAYRVGVSHFTITILVLYTWVCCPTIQKRIQKAEDFYSTLFHRGRLFSWLFSDKNAFVLLRRLWNLAIHNTLLWGEPIRHVDVAISSSDDVALVNDLFCELRMSSCCFRTASYLRGSLHYMCNLVGYFISVMKWWTVLSETTTLYYFGLT